jgi:uncharacterized iron-regulated protein
MNCRHALIIVVSFLVASTLDAYAAPQFLRLSDKRTVEFTPFVDEIEKSDVVFVAETHDEKKHHVIQFDILRTLHARNTPVAIGLEMFDTDSQQALDEWTKGTLAEEEFRAIYSRNWSYDWQLYREIFIFARDNHIPMIALNVPKPIISKVVRKGSKALDDTDRQVLPPRLSWTLNELQTDILRRVTSQVFANRPRVVSFANLCEAQALRNNAMAWNISKYRDKYPKRKIVVFTGTWHAIKSGAPEELKSFGKPGYRVVLPELPEFNTRNFTTTEADYLMLK